MNLENIKAEYKNFIEHICYAHSILYDLSIDTNKFLYQYIKSKSYNQDFAEKLEVNLLHLENMLQNTENIMDYIESTTIPKMSLPEPNNIINIDDYTFITNEYDKDIYVDLNNPLKIFQSH